MLSRTVRLQLIAFVVIALLGVSYVGVRYVGLLRLFGAGGYTVTLDLPQAGGIFTNAEVTYRGVTVGRVGAMRLTRTGIAVQLNITSSDRIPSNVRAVVTDRSVIGEQYVDLQPRTDAGPYLADGSVIDQKDAAIPPPIQRLLLSGDQLLKSVPLGALHVVINQSYAATQRVDTSLQQLIVGGKRFFTAAAADLPTTLELINASRTVLTTQQRSSAAITSFSRNLALVGKQLRRSNGDVAELIRKAGPAATRVRGLVSGVQNSLHTLLDGLLSTSVVFLGNRGGVRTVLSNLPVVVTIGRSVVTPQGINVGVVPTFFDPLPCVQGYEGTAHHTGLDAAARSPLNLSAGCTAPVTSGVDVRGSR